MLDEFILNLFETNGKMFCRREFSGYCTWWTVLIRPIGFCADSGYTGTYNVHDTDKRFLSKQENRLGSIYDVKVIEWNNL